MSRHQDELTSRHGFTVVNFDRLGVGFSDPYPDNATAPPSAADVACEMKYVMDNCGAVSDATPTKWIQVGGSMGSNVAAAFCALYPDQLCGFFNLDGLPHAFLQISCKKFLVDGGRIMNVMSKLRWIGLPRLAFSYAIRPMIPAIGDAFTPRQLIGVMCRKQFFVTTGFEYTTLMSCCDLEVAAWGRQATTEYDTETMQTMASLVPHESVIVDQTKDIPRVVTNERSKSELGTKYIDRYSGEFVAFEDRFRQLALSSPDEVNKDKTNCNWPEKNPRHPVGEFIGGVDAITIVHPLANSFGNMAVRVMCARCYKGLEREYKQNARNHAAARTSLHVIMSANGKAYYYPRLTHLNLWQQSNEIVDITNEMAQCIQELERHVEVNR